MAEKQHAQMEMSMTLESAINLLRSRDDCVVLPPSGVPVVGPRLKLPPGKRGQGETGSVCNCLTELAQLRGTRKKMPQKKDARHLIVTTAAFLTTFCRHETDSIL
jgi:hypothetical protein